MGTFRGSRGQRMAMLVMGVVLMVAGCASSGGEAGPAASSSVIPSATPSSPGATITSTPTPSRTPTPTGPPLQVNSIAPLDGRTVGVAMPISIVFTHPVADSARAKIEKRLTVTTSTPVTAAWHWFSERRVDFRPQSYWTPGTQVSLVADLLGVGDGHGRYGRKSYTRHFTIGADVRTHVDVKRHRTTVTRAGKVIRTMPSDAGSPDWPSWDGTMAVVNKSPTVRMDSCSVNISCDRNSPDYYDLTLPWDVRITWSGTFLHYSPADPQPGTSYGSHGCVHLSLADAKWFYNLAKEGDPVTITGSPRGKADGDNGYAGYNLSWDRWVRGSATGQFVTATPAA
ncbi:L,D-transpeptidase [Nocardioides sp. Kera G14]|uniref:L,D-transpeptidase n=1 Tax=Nocardioides sp. Kera G14 TaxID=2884264 RepID=UPI001D0FEDDD|nr:L,D-transpeptidase [Nocardioides sp. Kera G14]UDY23230.1 L,D-transpeptidase [Nocardioides sp. Kera G14]